jgi:hypothetical protein
MLQVLPTAEVATLAAIETTQIAIAIELPLMLVIMMSNVMAFYYLPCGALLLWFLQWVLRMALQSFKLQF